MRFELSHYLRSYLRTVEGKRARLDVLRLATSGLCNREISEKLNVPYYKVSGIIFEARRRKQISGKLGNFRETEPLHLILSAQNSEKFLEEAKNRGISPTQLGQRLIDTITNDDLFKVILEV